jgi:hypothetical protein
MGSITGQQLAYISIPTHGPVRGTQSLTVPAPPPRPTDAPFNVTPQSYTFTQFNAPVKSVNGIPQFPSVSPPVSAQAIASANAGRQAAYQQIVNSQSVLRTLLAGTLTKPVAQQTVAPVQQQVAQRQVSTPFGKVTPGAPLHQVTPPAAAKPKEEGIQITRGRVGVV